MPDFLNHLYEILTGLMVTLLMAGIGYGITIRRELDALKIQNNQTQKDVAALIVTVQALAVQVAALSEKIAGMTGFIKGAASHSATEAT